MNNTKSTTCTEHQTLFRPLLTKSTTNKELDINEED